MGRRYREVPYDVPRDVLYQAVVRYVRGKPQYYTQVEEHGTERALDARLLRNRLFYSSRVHFEATEKDGRSVLAISLKTHPLFLDLVGFWERYLDRVSGNLRQELASG